MKLDYNEDEHKVIIELEEDTFDKDCELLIGYVNFRKGNIDDLRDTCPRFFHDYGAETYILRYIGDYTNYIFSIELDVDYFCIEDTYEYLMFKNTHN